MGLFDRVNRPIRPDMVDVMLVQCWIFGMELCSGASLAALCELLEEWPQTYRPSARA